jgi:tellurite resistance protein
VGVVATFARCFVVVSRLLKGQVDASHAVPAWLVPGVATLDIAVTGRQMPMAWAAELNLLAWHRDPLGAAKTPSLMILVAPFAVGFLACSNVVGEIDRFAALLF